MSRPQRDMAVLLEYGLVTNKRQVVEARNAPAIDQIERGNRWVGAITVIREVGPNALVHGMEQLRFVHERE